MSAGLLTKKFKIKEMTNRTNGIRANIMKIITGIMRRKQKG